ncbi:MAG TPA: hypothetical protein VLG09_03895 [Candidatus Saccharimonadales bacterium]|nr:hypothetical protein [Candidatus Saccharimonadales bacterium]
MISFDPINLSDDDLGTCVLEYVKRAIQRVRDAGINLPLQASIKAEQYNASETYKIKHRFVVGNEYGNHYQSEINNLIKAGQNAAARWLEDQIDEPISIVPMITHQPEEQVNADEDISF